MKPESLFISAGEPSGDNAASRLISKLKDKRPELELFGLGGKRLAELGQEQFAEPSDLAVIGFWEVAKRFLYFRKLFHTCLNEINERQPKAVLLVDYPGFNLRLAKEVKKLGIKVIYYISPQVWAWGKGRIGQIRENVDLMLSILPFEKEFFARNNIETQFVGHYLLEDIPEEYIRSTLPGSNQVALLPGSRKVEVTRMYPSMIAAARLLIKKHRTPVVVAGIHGLYDYESLLNADDNLITIEYDNARKFVYESNYVITASGTATLETAIIGRPMVIVYKTGMLTYMIAKQLVELKMIGLANLVMDEKVLPELIQHEASPEAMANEVTKMIEDSKYRSSVVAKLNSLPDMLGGIGASERSAELIDKFLC